MPLKVAPVVSLEAAPVNGPAAGDLMLPVPYATQRPYTDLCWAACCQMVLEYNHVGQLRLCDVTSKVFATDCCTSPNTCDAVEWPQNAYVAFGFTCRTAGGALSPQSILAWISGLYPIQTYFQWNDQGSHTALIVGYYANGDLEIFDPQWGTGRQTYQYVLQAYGMGSWQDTWYDITQAANA